MIVFLEADRSPKLMIFGFLRKGFFRHVPVAILQFRHSALSIVDATNFLLESEIGS
jgi:hypothetical protein